MLFVLYTAAEFKQIDLKTRQKAAWEARQCAMHHWQFWFAILILAAATAGGSLLQQWLFGAQDTAIGAGVGFLLGICWYARVYMLWGCPIIAAYFHSAKRGRDQPVENDAEPTHKRPNTLIEKRNSCGWVVAVRGKLVQKMSVHYAITG